MGERIEIRMDSVTKQYYQEYCGQNGIKVSELIRLSVDMFLSEKANSPEIRDYFQKRVRDTRLKKILKERKRINSEAYSVGRFIEIIDKAMNYGHYHKAKFKSLIDNIHDEIMVRDNPEYLLEQMFIYYRSIKLKYGLELCSRVLRDMFGFKDSNFLQLEQLGEGNMLKTNLPSGKKQYLIDNREVT